MDTIQQPKPDTERPSKSSFFETPSHRYAGPPNTAVQKLTAYLAWIKNFFDYLVGAREEPPAGAAFLTSSIWTGLWWGLMIGLILLFCGQTSKFIYIDF